MVTTCGLSLVLRFVPNKNLYIMKTKSKKSPKIQFAILSVLLVVMLSSFTYISTEEEREKSAMPNVTVEVRNYSDWDIRIKRKSDNGYTNKNIIKASGKGSKSFTGTNTIVIQWKDGMKWRKYNEYKVTGGTMCLEATGKVMELRGIKIVKCR